jgi:uncharacterized protein YqgC (DUF456 family)
MSWVGLGLMLASDVVGLVLIPLGLPGLWLMVLGFLGFGWLTQFRTVGLVMVGAVVGIAAVAEIIEWWLGFRIARRYGGSTRAGWGALLGGIIGAAVGAPVPVLGSVIAAVVGSFLGAAAMEYTRSLAVRRATRVGWGAVVGRAAAAAVKVALGMVIAAVGLFAAFR